MSEGENRNVVDSNNNNINNQTFVLAPFPVTAGRTKEANMFLSNGTTHFILQKHFFGITFVSQLSSATVEMKRKFLLVV